MIEDVQQLRSRIKVLEEELYGRENSSKCCPSEVMISFISLNMKKCNGCGAEIAWNLKESQQPLFDGKR